MHGQPIAVLARLDLDPGEGRPLRLRLDRPRRLPIDVDQLVSMAVARRKGELPDRHALRCVDVGAVTVLHGPPRRLQGIFSRASCSGVGMVGSPACFRERARWDDR